MVGNDILKQIEIHNAGTKLFHLLNEVTEILLSQGKDKLYDKQIIKILQDQKLIKRYSVYNVAEFLVQLEFDRLGWKVQYQKRDNINGYRFDFYLEPFYLAIEIDEKYHKSHKQRAKDELRDKTVGEAFIVRIPEQYIRGNVSNVTEIIIGKILRNYSYRIDYDLEYKCKKCGIDIQMLKNRVRR